MMILGIDTTTPQSGVALLEGETVRAVRRAQVTTHSESLLVLIDEALGEAGAQLKDLAAVVCAAGPGSFTGLRIGLATAKGLCFGLGRPLVLVSSLAALAARVRTFPGAAPGAPPEAPTEFTVAACIDAFKGEVYAGLYQGYPPRALGAERVLPPERFARELEAQAAAGPVVLVGDGMVRYPELRVAGLAAVDVGPPDPIDVARLGALRFARGERDDLALASPSYIRPSEAELMAERKARDETPRG